MFMSDSLDYVYWCMCMAKPKRKRQVTTLTLDPKVIKEAKDLGLNISKVAENALIEVIKRLKGTDCPDNNCSDGNALNSKERSITRRRVGGWLSGESLRKLCPSNRLVGP
jgi:post-segregation antitoxin (ccd killing protein)